MFADVIVDISHSEADKIFEYSYSDCKVLAGSRVLVPFGSKTIEGIVIKTKKQCEFDEKKVKPILSVLEETPALTNETLALSEFIVKTCFVTRALSFRLFLPAEMRKGRVREQFVKYAVLDENINTDELLSSLKKNALKQRDLILFLQENGKTALSYLNENFGSAVKALTEKNALIITSEKRFRSPYKDLGGAANRVVLTDKQQQAIDFIEKSENLTTLLFGVTGSGKTEVYLDLIDKTLKKGKTAIMLVPEISLTPQMLKQLRARFGENAAIMHSGLSAGERYDEWWRLRTGEAKIAIGARSAIFAPVENLGLIVIDEEHDGSYTSESAPRYNTVDVAKFRSHYNGAKLVLGSATPSVESFLNAQNGEYGLFELPDRINKKPLPDIEIADMRKEVRRGNNTPFSSALKDELQKCLNKGNQAILFLNQRGYSKTVVCTECGHVQKCSSCDVSLTYHREDDSLLCHYCGAKYKMIKACTECGSPYIKYGGFGTEKIVADLKVLFPSARILRMDRDTTKNKEGHFKILNEFSSRNADILVGTQMIAKGHDFPFVTLVGILDADMSLHFSDFRSAERTFELITQVAGRSGRAGEAGKVVLQTYQPDNHVLRQAINYDYKGFFEREISIRKATAFPPFTEIIRVLVQSENDALALDTVKELYDEIGTIKRARENCFRFFGCMKAPLKKLQGKYRYQILMRIDNGNEDILEGIFRSVNAKNKGKINAYMEINPNNLT
ncbi:MAG: primosomal protein N' [Clostridia bacterium]|nr:primosomal protein N' [Clostridia bacterium]